MIFQIFVSIFSLGIKIIIGLKSKQKIYATKISDLRTLNLKSNVHNIIEKEFLKNKMNYDLYAESANSFNDLKSSLRKRGYKNLPMHQLTEHASSFINNNVLVTERSTMLRRNSEVKK